MCETPYASITASNGFRQTYTATCRELWRDDFMRDSLDCDQPCMMWEFEFRHSDVVTFNGLDAVEWVDFTVFKTKLKITDLTFTTAECPSTVQYTILDQWTDRVPTGSGLEQLDGYGKYDSYPSPAKFECSPSQGQECMHFYGSLHIGKKYGDEDETVRMEMKDGECFDLESFEMDLEDTHSMCETPYASITASNGFRQTYTATCRELWRDDFMRDSLDCDQPCMMWEFDFRHSDVVTFDGLDAVEWVDFTVFKTKLKITDLTF